MPNTFDPKTDIPDLGGKVIVVTGGNAGIGAETVLQLAAHNPRTIYLCARTPSKADAFIAVVKKDHPSADIRAIQLDLTSLPSAKAAAEKILESAERLDLLILNAGTAGQKPGTTDEGYEVHFGVNHVAHALFTQILMPLVLKTTGNGQQDVRIVVVASSAARALAPRRGIEMDSLKTGQDHLGPNACYGQSKLANVLFAAKLAEVYPSVKSTSIHPGIIKSEIMGKGTSDSIVLSIFAFAVSFIGKSVAEGAKCQLWAATSPAVQTGKYYEPVGKETKASKYQGDQKMIDALWSWTNDELAAHGGKGWPASA